SATLNPSENRCHYFEAAQSRAARSTAGIGAMAATAQLRGGGGSRKSGLFFGVERDRAKRIGHALAGSGFGVRGRRDSAFGSARGGEGRNADPRRQSRHARIHDRAGNGRSVSRSGSDREGTLHRGQ